MPNESANTVEVRHLTKAYDTHTVVDDLSFAIPRGCVVGLIGPNGAGKTTTMKMLLGLVAPTGGDVDLFGIPVGSRGWGETLKRVGSMIEAPPIYDRMSARSNLQYQSLAVTGRVDNGEVDRLLRIVDLADRADDRPRGYSLGMKQRLGIAIAMMGRPELVILDEPANGLDPAGIRDIRTLLRRLPEDGTTVLVSSHQLAEVQQACDRLVVLAGGRLVTDDTTSGLLARSKTGQLLVTVSATEEARAHAVLAAAGATVTTTPTSSTFAVTLSDVDDSGVNRILAESGIYASSIHRPTVSLEDAFLELVGTPPPPTNEPAQGLQR